jgi:hypothetical protein
VSGSALKRESLVFEPKYARRNCMDALVLKMNGNYSRCEQHRGSDKKCDNA